MFGPTKQTDVKFFRYTTHTPYLTSSLDCKIKQCTRVRGQQNFSSLNWNCPIKLQALYAPV